jgi:hypothetical protein
MEESIEAVKSMSSRKFNDAQCDYLVDKLKVAVQSACSFLELSCGEHHGPPSVVDIARYHGSDSYADFVKHRANRLHVDSVNRVEIFKFLLALAKQIESFVQGCCQDEWIQSAITLTNVEEYVLSLGFKLELCRIAFTKESAASLSLTPANVNNIHAAEAKSVEQKASVDWKTLHEKVLLEQKSSLSSVKSDLLNCLLGRLLKDQMNPTSVLPKSFLWNSKNVTGLFEWLSPTEPLGRGASGIVRKDMWQGMPVARKSYPGAENLEFLKELEILGKLWHPNITSMYCWVKEKNRSSIIMELMDEDLYALMDKIASTTGSPPFSILEAIDLMLRISKGVKYLHDQGIVHRDLKSFNILVKSVNESGYAHVKLADFGLSKTKVFSTSLSEQTFNASTSRWMPPELIKVNKKSQGSSSKNEGKPKYAKKNNVYSFAIVCYEILTGNLPFQDVASGKIVKDMVTKGERPHLPNHCPIRLKDLIEKCWNQVPEERPSFAVICLELEYLKYLLMTSKYLQPKLNQLLFLIYLSMLQ